MGKREAREVPSLTTRRQFSSFAWYRVGCIRNYSVVYKKLSKRENWEEGVYGTLGAVGARMEMGGEYNRKSPYSCKNI